MKILVKRLELHGAVRQAQGGQHLYLRVHAYLEQSKLPTLGPGDGWVSFDAGQVSTEPIRASRPKGTQSANV
jgi:hypothetical protein